MTQLILFTVAAAMQRTTEDKELEVRRSIEDAELAARRLREDQESAARWLKTNRGYIGFLIYNMQRRTHRHGVARKDYASALHKMMYDETYFDVHTGEERDAKVRLYFEPIIELFQFDRKIVLAEIKRALDKYFPIPEHLNREWNPIWKTVPFTPKKKSDTRTTRVTIQFNWSIKKEE